MKDHCAAFVPVRRSFPAATDAAGGMLLAFG
jgi:hypothetical protein